MGKVALDAERSGQLLVLGILSAIVHGKRSLCLCGQIVERPRNRLIGFGSGLAFQFRKPEHPGLALDYAVQGRLALAGDQCIAFPMTKLLSLIDRLRPGIDGNPIGNLGFSHFSPFALDAPFPVGATKLGDELFSIRSISVIDELVDRLRADWLGWPLFLESARDDLRGPADLELSPDILLNLLALEQGPIMPSGQLPLSISSLRPAWRITTILRGSVTGKLPRDRALVPAEYPGDLGRAFALPMH